MNHIYNYLRNFIQAMSQKEKYKKLTIVSWHHLTLIFLAHQINL